MTDQELLKAIEGLLDQKLVPIYQRLDGIDQRLDGIDQRLDRVEEELCEVKEGLSEVRTGVNTLLEWADEMGGTIAFPIPKMNL